MIFSFKKNTFQRKKNIPLDLLSPESAINDALTRINHYEIAFSHSLFYTCIIFYFRNQITVACTFFYFLLHIRCGNQNERVEILKRHIPGR